MSTGSSKPSSLRIKGTTSPLSDRSSASHSALVIWANRPALVSVTMMRIVSTILPVHSGLSWRCVSTNGNSRCTRFGAVVRATSSKLTLPAFSRMGIWFGAASTRNCRKGSPLPSSTKRSTRESTATTRPRSTSTHHASIESSTAGSQYVLASPSRMLAAAATLEPARLIPMRIR